MAIRQASLKAYYFLRPAVPQRLRVAGRRLFAARSKRLHAKTWPINPITSRVPDWWAGWPEGKKFAFVVTHDVEGRRGLRRCHKLAEMEIALGFRSAFNFVPEGEYQTPELLRNFLKSQGFEIGIHDLRHDGMLYASRKGFERSARRINHYLADWGAVGFRSGFMLHNLDWIRDLHIQYDASTFDTDPFEPQPDGANTIFPFWVERNDNSAYVELPYTLAQDSTLFSLLQEKTTEIWTRKLDWVAQHGGLALVNVHPDYVCFDGKCSAGEYDVRLYRELLEYVSCRHGQEAWFALPRQIAAHVRSVRQNLSLEKPNSGRATQGVDCSVATDKAEDACPARHKAAVRNLAEQDAWRLHGNRVGMVMLSHYPGDPRPRRAAQALASAGARVDLICVTLEKDDVRHEVVNGINVLRIPIQHSRGSGLSYAFEYSTFLLAATAILGWRSLTGGYDLVYVHNMPDLLVLTALIPKFFGAKVILDLHDPMPELMTTIFGVSPDAFVVRLLRRFEKLSIRIADSVITVNLACAKLFSSRSCPADKIQVVMNSPDELIFRQRPPHAGARSTNREKDRFVIMYHGSIVERNGLGLAVDALARVRESIPNTELRIYGWHTPFLAKVMESVREKGLDEAVRYYGPKSPEQLAVAINECDLGIIPNLRSRFTEINTPTRIFEYLASGKPVIAPRAGGICDYFDESSLIFFGLGDARDLAQKISYVFFHPSEVNQIVKRGQDILGEHTWSQERRRLIGVVLELLEKKEGLLAEKPIAAVEISEGTRISSLSPSVPLALRAAEERLSIRRERDIHRNLGE